MSTRRRGVLAVLGIIALALLGGGAYRYFANAAAERLIDDRDANVVALGEELYVEHCAACHGAELEGQADWRERRDDGRLPAPPHDVSGHTWHHPDQQLFELTKAGPAAFVGGTYESDMPGYGGELTDDEIRAVLAFIKNSWPPEIRERHDGINRRAAKQSKN